MKLNKTKISSVSTTSLCSDKESCSFDSNPSTMLLPNPTTTATFRSFIKTKSGIMIRKDHHSDEDDEEVAKLCEDSECSKISTDILSATTTPTGNITASLANNNNKKKMEDIQENSNRSILTEFSKDSSNLVVPDGFPDQPTADHQRFRSKFNSIDAADQRHSFISTDTFQSSSSPNESNSISNTSFTANDINDGQNDGSNDGPKPVGTNISSSSSSSSTSSKHHRHHHRTNPILPILKPNRFVKNHAKGSGNLLFSTHGNKNPKTTKKRSNSESSTSNAHTTTSQDLVKSLRSDRMIVTKPDEDRRRRTIIIEKQKNSFGFTLQTYGIKQNQEIELITYVDEVTYGGPAFRGGMRPGDVILSINGRDMEKADHPTLVNYINSCEKTMRLVVLFEDCVRKIELHLKFIKLQKALQQKLTQLEILNQREDQILLNAALRGCCSLPDQPSEITTGGDLNKSEEIVVPPINTRQKQIKQKCKSLDVSLNDLNCNLEDDVPNHHSVTFQRNSRANYLSTTAATITVSADDVAQSQSNQKDEENEILISQQTDDEDEVTMPKPHSTIDPQQQPPPPEQLNFRSISLPQSVANSLDCLTNEAYEDDENLLQPPTQSLANIQAKSNTSILSISDKDFITKL